MIKSLTETRKLIKGTWMLLQKTYKISLVRSFFLSSLFLLSIIHTQAINVRVEAMTKTQGGGNTLSSPVSPHGYYNEAKTPQCAKYGSGYAYFPYGDNKNNVDGGYEWVDPAGCYKWNKHHSYLVGVGSKGGGAPSYTYRYTKNNSYNTAKAQCVRSGGKWFDSRYNAYCKGSLNGKTCAAKGRIWHDDFVGNYGCSQVCIDSKNKIYDKNSGTCVANKKLGAVEKCDSDTRCQAIREQCQNRKSQGKYWDGKTGKCKTCASGKVSTGDKCVKSSKASTPDPSKSYCEGRLHRNFTGSKTKGHCKKRGEPRPCKSDYPYYIASSPYDYCSKTKTTDPGGAGTGTGTGNTGGKKKKPTNPNNKARQNCENKLHRVWVGSKDGKGKCSTKCQEGFKHPKDKPHACVAKKDKKDSKKPTVKLTQPAQKSTADKTIKLAAKAKDNVAVSKVVFYSNVSKDGSKVLADGKFKQVAEDTSKPYTTDLNTEKLADKTKLKVYAVAVDSNGNKAKSSVAKVTVTHGTGPVDPGEGDCSKNLKQSFDVALPAQLSAKKISNNKGIAVQSTCDAAGQSVDYVLKLTGINMTLQAADLEAYRQTADGKYTLSEDITIEDVDATDGTDKSYVEVSYSATDGDAYDLNSASAAILNHIFLNKVDDGDESKKPDDDKKPDTGTGTGTTTGTTPGTQTPGTICTDNTDGSATCTDANGNTYSLGAKGKGAGVLPNTGTSALLGIFAVAAAGVGAVVYKIVKKRGASPATNPYDQM